MNELTKYVLQMDEKQVGQYSTLKKSKTVAYVLWLFLGYFGIHRLYLRDMDGFCIYLCLFVASLIVPQYMWVGSLLFMLYDVIGTYLACDKANATIAYEVLMEGDNNG